jgi:hypothetical protein
VIFGFKRFQNLVQVNILMYKVKQFKGNFGA